jgi:hypothetical protein
MGLLSTLHELGRLETMVHNAGADHPATWGALALVYRDRPPILAELTILENCMAADLVRFFAASEAERSGQIGHVLLIGGVTNWEGKFVRVEY